MSDFWKSVERKWRSEDLRGRPIEETDSNRTTQTIMDNQEVLMRGLTGGPKTLVLLKKAKKKALNNEAETIIIFTYGSSLENASRITMNRHNLRNLSVSTFHSWVAELYKQTFREQYKLITDDEKRSFIKLAISGTKINEEFTTNEEYIDFLQKEFAFIKNMRIRTMPEYASMCRDWENSKPPSIDKDKRLIFAAFRNYEILKKTNSDYEDFVHRLLECKEHISENMKFDHIFIDEAEDFQINEILLLKKYARKTITIAGDKSLGINDTTFSWNAVGLSTQGERMKILMQSYRSTKQIMELAVSLQSHDPITKDEEYVLPVLPERTGSKPVLRKFDDEERHDECIIAMVNAIIVNSPAATVGILYRSSRKWRHRLGKALERKKIPYTDVQAKEEVDPFSPGVKLSSFRSSKGLEFDVVLLIDLVEPTALPTEEGTSEFWDVERRLLYVAMTRAKSLLYMLTYETENRLLLELDDSLYDIL